MEVAVMVPLSDLKRVTAKRAAGVLLPVRGGGAVEYSSERVTSKQEAIRLSSKEKSIDALGRPPLI